MALTKRRKSAPPVEPPTKKRKSLKRSTPTDAKPVQKATEPYDGPVPEGTEYRDDLILVSIADAPDHPMFPKLGKDAYPPETFYAYNTKTHRTEHMLSYDAYNTGLAWDMDYSGRYFLRVERGLRCPRFIEYCYDSAKAQKAGEHWSHSHDDYKGSLSTRLSGSASQPDRRLAPRAKRSLQRHTGAKTGSLTKRPVAPMPEPTPARPKRSLKRRAEPESNLLTDKGLDRRALDENAKSLSEELAGKFGGGQKPKRVLKRKASR